MRATLAETQTGQVNTWQQEAGFEVESSETAEAFALEQRAAELLGHMTLEEKASLTVGRDAWTTQPIDRLGIPSIWLSDGPTGLRKVSEAPLIGLGISEIATCFPTESCLGASWDSELVREVGRAIGLECQAHDVQVLLGPGVNLKRSPLYGRNFEFFSEDPVLSGELAAAYVDGLQQQGVGASVKHYTANECETDRMRSDSIVDERTLRELYLRPFEIVVEKAQPWTMMAAYNRLNGVYCTESSYLLKQIAEEWDYRGVFVSDWSAVDDRLASLAGGLHLQMPAAPTAESVVEAVRSGRLSGAQLDALVLRLLTLILKADAARTSGTIVDFAAHHELARRAAAESIVLLKNEDPLLPLEGEMLEEIAVIGVFAREPRIQGAGSSQVNPARIENLFDELVRQLGPCGRVAYAAGCRDESGDPILLKEAQYVARQATVAVVMVGLPESHDSEGLDRPDLGLPEWQDSLVEAVLAVQPHTVVVLVNGAAVAMPWVQRAPAILETWLGGQAGGGALVDIMLGRVSPSGKLAETFPVCIEDTPAYLNFPDDGQGRARFAEGLFTGYRWYDARKIAPLFPFGHGLSYTSFAYEDVRLDHTQLLEGETLGISCTVRNTGARAGREVVQLYVHERQPRLRRPEQELKAFASVRLQPGEAATVQMTLCRRDFAYFDPQAGDWLITSGTFDILIGASSRDIRLQQSIAVQAAASRRAPLGRRSLIGDFMSHPSGPTYLRPLLARALYGPDAGDATAGPKGGDDLPYDPFLYSLPVSRLVVMGAVSDGELAAIIERVNGDA